MDLDQARAFVREHHRAVLLTTHPDGRPQLTPILAGVDDDGDIIVSTRETAAKTRNARRDPKVAVCVFTDGFFGEWVQIDGEARVISLPEAMEPLVDYYRRVAGEHSDWDDYRAAMERERRVLLKITPTRAGPDVKG
ncbi:PPOX class probable F420-dependent enzyme [Thermocatellispora tengchongensis]|uniref:PPOX class probable F420-dependent enzyme n=1 Tax=Thermocatellispora tengchongensis TaxID=1073253 RepID=A0A840P853_9ACTN|nr:PPOX class F420-dependent oxidoreductase [Thermocatellispora tengchongensis]MBB5134103.1 PPOX class probable F420-dependent enzyme [Thermocatellispora tengchongensis]